MNKINIGHPVKEIEVTVKLVPRMRRTKWSKHRATKQRQFQILTDEIGGGFDNIKDWEWRAAYVDAIEKQHIEEAKV